jgi:hypothetical protein
MCAIFIVVPIQDDTFLMLLNAHHETVNFVLPGQEEVRWELIIDTRLEEGFLETPKIFASSEEYEIGARSFSLLRLRVGEQSRARSLVEEAKTKLGKSTDEKKGRENENLESKKWMLSSKRSGGNNERFLKTWAMIRTFELPDVR